MILEQALFHLPEILTGSGYPRQRYEGGIVAAFSLAILQSLNGRNIPNPIACLHIERPFRGVKGWKRGASKAKRYLRSDLYLNLDDVDIVSKRLSAYGWKSRNWVESKFFRKSTSNKQQNTASLLADLLRLLALVPNSMSRDTEKKVITGRYLLHIYEAFDPTDYLSYNRQLGNGSEPRKWLAPLIEGGEGSCERIKLADYETDGVLGQINSKLKDVELEYQATTWRIGPTFDLGKNAKQYVCILSRINSFTLARGDTELSITSEGVAKASPSWDDFRSKVREHVGSWINLKPGAEKQKPDPIEGDEIDANESE